MLFRAIARLTILAGCLVLTAALTGSAGAQNYPPPAGPPGAYPPNYRMPAPPADDDDEVEYLPPPGVYGGRSQASAPYPTAPYPNDADPRRPGPAIEQQALPAPGSYPPSTPYPQQAPAAYPPPPPGAAYPAPGAYPQQPPAPPPYDNRYAPREAYGVPPEQQGLRPPADISPPQQGAILDLNRGPGAPGPVPPGAVPPMTAPGPGSAVASLPPEDQPETGERKELPPHLRRQMVDYVTREPAGTIVIDTPNTYLYLVLGNGKAMRYGVGVGREGFTWNGTERITRMAEWPDWHPPSEMIERQPYLPRFMAGGESNPLGARALYLGKTVYRIHGTNQPSTIGSFVSSGCIRLVNDDVMDLFSRVQVGTRVVVLPGSPPASASAAPPNAPAAR